jgi:hypothetical protein
VVNESRQISQLIRDWFQGEKRNWGWLQGQICGEEIDKRIAAMPDPLTEPAAAWKRSSRVDPGLHIAMDLCKYTEWAADTDLGLTSEPFEGVPHLMIRFV